MIGEEDGGEGGWGEVGGGGMASFSLDICGPSCPYLA